MSCLLSCRHLGRIKLCNLTLNSWIVRPSSYRLRRRSRPAGFTKAAALICIYMEHILRKRFRRATDGLERLVTPTFAKKRHGHHRPEDYPGDRRIGPDGCANPPEGVQLLAERPCRDRPASGVRDRRRSAPGVA